MISISSDFDSGNIESIDASDPANIQLEIKPDGKADFFQWFFFKVEGANGSALTMRILNVAKASYLGGWKDYRAVASYDLDEWVRVDTAFDGKELTIGHKPEKDTVYYAYFAPYPTSRYRTYIDAMIDAPGLAHAPLGETLDGQQMDYFRAGTGPLNFWVIARQHPGETMGSWWMEGFLERITDEKDKIAQKLLEAVTLHIVPCMNLDGAKRGHLRTNAAGKDLNRAWRNASMEESPEVYLTREKMRETGVDFFLDVHGDEAIANNFLNSAEGIPAWNERHAKMFNAFSSRMLEVSKDFQDKEGYPTPPPGKANLDIANCYVAETWDCLSMTLEMPFKDANVNPDPVHGWSPARCRTFAREHVTVMAEIAGMVR